MAAARPRRGPAGAADGAARLPCGGQSHAQHLARPLAREPQAREIPGGLGQRSQLVPGPAQRQGIAHPRPRAADIVVRAGRRSERAHCAAAAVAQGDARAIGPRARGQRRREPDRRGSRAAVAAARRMDRAFRVDRGAGRAACLPRRAGAGRRRTGHRGIRQASARRTHGSAALDGRFRPRTTVLARRKLDARRDARRRFFDRTAPARRRARGAQARADRRRAVDLRRDGRHRGGAERAGRGLAEARARSRQPCRDLASGRGACWIAAPTCNCNCRCSPPMPPAGFSRSRSRPRCARMAGNSRCKQGSRR